MKLTILFILCCHSVAFGQNLVPNSGFEAINDTISKFTEDNLQFNSKIKNWITPNTASPDLIIPGFNEKYIVPPTPHAGSNMVGIQFNRKDWIEYIGVNLTQALIPNRTYYVEYWIRRSYCISPKMNVDQKMNDNFGILFSSKSINTSNGEMIIADAQVKIDTQQLITYQEWVKVSSYFTPKATYDKLYLGQFQQAGEAPQVKMGYYVIDDILVEELTDYRALDQNTKLTIGSIIPLNHIHFKTGTTNLKDKQSYASLKELATYLNLNPSINVRINGHTDSNGSQKSNLLLSKRRAKFIAQQLIQHGISKKRIEWKGFGEEFPIADNGDKAGQSKNRRVEFEVME